MARPHHDQNRKSSGRIRGPRDVSSCSRGMEESQSVESRRARQGIEIPRSAHNQHLRRLLRSGSELASESGRMKRDVSTAFTASFIGGCGKCAWRLWLECVTAIPESSRMNADDRLSLASLGRVEGGDGIVESRDVADVRPQSTIPHPLDDLTQLGAIGYDDEVDSQAARGPRLGRAGDGHQRSSGANQARRPLRDVAADDIENQIDFADIFQGVVIEVDELLRAEVESRLTAGSAPGADDVRAGLTCELGRHRTDYAGRTVHEDALPRTKAAVLEQPLPRGQARHHKGRAHCEVNVPRQRREVASLDVP